LYFFHTAGVPNTILSPGTSFSRKIFTWNYLIFSKSILWQPVMHSRVYFNIVHFSLNFIKIRNCNGYIYILSCTAYNLWAFKWIVHFDLLFRDWTNSQRGIGLFPFYSNLCSVGTAGINMIINPTEYNNDPGQWSYEV